MQTAICSNLLCTIRPIIYTTNILPTFTERSGCAYLCVHLLIPKRLYPLQLRKYCSRYLKNESLKQVQKAAFLPYAFLGLGK